MTRLPLLPPEVVKGSLRADGTRETVQPADVRGRYTTARRVVYVVLLIVAFVLPWVSIGGNPAVFLDIETRRFFLFGRTFNAQDAWLLFFLLTGVGFGLIYLTAWLGRVWCGWACPQTVLLDTIYRRIERLIQGPREARIRRNAGAWTTDRTVRVGLTHAAYLVVSLALAHGVLSYFVSAPGVFRLVASGPTAHTEAFVWVFAMTGILYFNFAHFREQLCLAICPYGRLQSVLIDVDSLTIGYDSRRGEPRAKATFDATHDGEGAQKSAGDCVDCKRCVVVCPTGIDIRNGLQMDCVACTACIDACDDIMDRLGRPRGLIRYASTAGLAGGKTRFLRLRIIIYSALMIVGLVVAALAFGKHADFEANLLRLPGPPYTFEGDSIVDGFEVHVVNKTSHAEEYVLAAEGDAPEASIDLPLPVVRLGPLEGTRVPVLVSVPRAAYKHDFALRLHVRTKSEPEKVIVGRFLGAAGGGA